MNTDRMLAYGAAESIYFMCGRVPRRSYLRRHASAWAVVAGVAALLLIAGTARAGTFAVSENEAGGQIRLTDIACKDGGKIVMSTSSGGQVKLYGCASLDGDSILVAWSDGDLSVFPLTGWQPVNSLSEPEPASRWP